jgi:cobalt/nickel transport system permease protein
MHHHFIDRFAMGDSPIHRLDARAKLLAVLGYTVVLISYDRYAVTDLAPLAVLPLALLWFARVPVWFAVRRVLILSPFILMLVLMSPFYDRALQTVAFGPWHFTISGGWLTAADISIKFALGVMALTALMCSTRFALLLEAMQRLGLPQVVVMQLGFLYRYVFVLIDEAMRVRRARDFRGAALAPVGRRLAAAGGVIGMLFLRTLDRSQRVHLAMAARGYCGPSHSLRQLRFTRADAVFLLVVVLYLAACRWGYPRWF